MENTKLMEKLKLKPNPKHLVPVGANNWYWWFTSTRAWLVPRGGTLAPVRAEPVLKGGAFSAHQLVPVMEPALKALTNRR